MSLDLTGSFTTRFTGNPATEPGTVTTVVYKLDLDWTSLAPSGPIEYYIGDVGSGEMIDGLPKFDYTIRFVFSWNPVTHVAEVKLGRIRPYTDAEEYQDVPQNVVDESHPLTDENQFWAFDSKRFDEAVSVSRTMNAILKDPTASIRITDFTDEERNIHYRRSYIHLEKLYFQCDPENVEMRRYYRGQIESHYLIYVCDAAEYKEGDYYYSLDTSIHGPFETLGEAICDANKSRITAVHGPAMPHIAQVLKGEWASVSYLTLADGTFVEDPY